jgi:PASTA domain
VFGHKVKKQTAYIAGAAGAGVIIIAIMRKRSATAAAAASTTSALVTDPAGNQCATLDPATGYCPGTAADTSAQQSAAINSAADTAAVDGGGGDGYYYPPTTGVTGTGSAVPTFTDNASWGQYVETALGSNGSDATAAAIAKYLSGQPVTAQQQTLIEEAIAVGNKPPVSGPNGNPPSMTLATTTSPTPPPTSTTPAAGTVMVPDVVGDDAVNASSALQSAGLLMHPEPAAVKGKVHTILTQNPKARATAKKGSTVTITYKTT